MAAEQRKWARRNIWQVVPEDGTPYELLFDKDYWGVMASKLRPFDHIEVLADYVSFWAELLVLMATKTQATVMELRAPTTLSGPL